MAAHHWKPCKGHVAEADGSAAELWRGSEQRQVVAGVVPHLKRFLQRSAHLIHMCFRLTAYAPSTDSGAIRLDEPH